MKYLIFLLAIACSSKEVPVSPKNFCEIESNIIDKRAILINVNSKSDQINNCFKNYLKFTKEKEYSFNGCVRLLVSKRGQTKRVNVIGPRLPTDLKMCIEQELWTFNFANLYLSQEVKLQFPINLHQ